MRVAAGRWRRRERIDSCEEKQRNAPAVGARIAPRIGEGTGRRRTLELDRALREDGIVVVFRADESMEIVAKNKLSEGLRASPAAAGGRLYLRTLEHLYCISEQTN